MVLNWLFVDVMVTLSRFDAARAKKRTNKKNRFEALSIRNMYNSDGQYGCVELDCHGINGYKFQWGATTRVACLIIVVWVC